jgi:hypothetical protein
MSRLDTEDLMNEGERAERRRGKFALTWKDLREE